MGLGSCPRFSLVDDHGSGLISCFLLRKQLDTKYISPLLSIDMIYVLNLIKSIVSNDSS